MSHDLLDLAMAFGGLSDPPGGCYAADYLLFAY
jgi:hypothetical protein